MPTERFNRLSSEKKEIIWKASMSEFIAVPYEKVSINKIIQKAGISRGSFYTYFEDKRDLLEFIMEDTKQKWMGFCLDALEEANGDILMMMENLMDVAIQFCGSNDLFNLHKNLFMCPDMLKKNIALSEEDAKGIIAERFYLKIDRSQLRDGSLEGITLLFRMCLIAMMACITDYYQTPDKVEQIKEAYRNILLIFRNGTYKVSET